MMEDVGLKGRRWFAVHPFLLKSRLSFGWFLMMQSSLRKILSWDNTRLIGIVTSVSLTWNCEDILGRPMIRVVWEVVCGGGWSPGYIFPTLWHQGVWRHRMFWKNPGSDGTSRLQQHYGAFGWIETARAFRSTGSDQSQIIAHIMTFVSLWACSLGLAHTYNKRVNPALTRVLILL